MQIEGGPFRLDGVFEDGGGSRIDCVPHVMFTEKVNVRYRLDLTEQQLNYLHALVVDIDEGDNAEMPNGQYDELVGQLSYHHAGIHGPDDNDDRPPQADNE